MDNNSGNLSSGAAKLKDGAQTLSDGMIQFDEEGIQKLSDAYHGDVEALLDRVVWYWMQDSLIIPSPV